MAVAKLAYGIADYIQVDGAFELMAHFTEITENPNAQTEETQYTVNKSKTVDTTGYQTSWAFNGIQHTDSEGKAQASAKAVNWLETVGKEQKLGADCQTLFCRVELDNPIGGEANTFYARQCKVAAEITELGNTAGEKRGISGNLNALEDIVVGKFNTSTKTFTANA